MPHDSEGFAYLGLSVIVLTPFAAITVLRRKCMLQTGPWPLIAVLTSLFLIAVSHRIAIGGTEFVVPLPLGLIDLRQVVRSAPRFVWPMAYAMVIGTWTVVARWVEAGKNRIRTAVLVAVFTVQILGVMPYAIAQQLEVKKLSDHTTYLVSNRWNLLSRNHDSISIVPTFDFHLDHNESTTEVQAWAASDRLIGVVQFGSEHHLKLNFAYVHVQ